MGIDAQILIKTRAHVTKEQILEWAYNLGSSFGHDKFYAMRGDRHCIELVPEYTQDGETLYPEDGETFLEVYPSTRYYGLGYERGDLPFLVSLANWIEVVIPDTEVWYGGDSSGVVAELFDKDARDVLWAHFCKVNHLPYVGQFDDRKALRAFCEFCNQYMTQHGYGASYAAFGCRGCGYSIVTKDSGYHWQSKRGEGANEKLLDDPITLVRFEGLPDDFLTWVNNERAGTKTDPSSRS